MLNILCIYFLFIIIIIIFITIVVTYPLVWLSSRILDSTESEVKIEEEIEKFNKNNLQYLIDTILLKYPFLSYLNLTFK